MTLLLWLAASSLLWGGVLWIAGRALQRSNTVSGATRQWIWRGATALLLAPWIAAPFVMMFGLGLAPAEQVAVATASVTPAPDALLAVQPLHDVVPGAASVETAVVERSEGVLAWLGQASLAELLVLAFIAGWIVRFVAAQLALRSLLGIVNLSREAEPGIARTFVQSWAQRLKLRPAPRLRVVAEQHSPFSFGILRPTICVPEGMEDKLSRGSLDLVIGHESLHVARGDGWLRPIERVTADILWFNPFAWLIRRELDVARELAVDEAVLAMSASRVAYARTLRDVAGFAAALAANAPAASMSLPGGRNLMLRVSRTLSQTKQKPARAVVIAACLAGLIGAPLAVAQVMMVAPAPPAPPPLIAPVPPAPPAPPEAPPAGEYDAKTGEVRATFKAKVIAVSGDAASSYGVELLQTKRNDENEVCYAKLEGLGELNVVKGDVVGEGGLVGKSRKGGKMRFAVSCSDDLDASGKPKASPPPVPPEAPLPPGGPSDYDQVAPVAPPAPVAPVAPVRAPLAPLPPMPVSPVAAPAPLAAPSPMPHMNMVAPVAPRSPVTPKPMPAPLAPPSPVTPMTPMVAPTPPTPVTPLTPMTPMAAPAAPVSPSPLAPMAAPPAPPTPPALKPYQPTGTPAPLREPQRAVLEAPARVTSGFGQRVDPFTQATSFHTGVDIAAPIGAAVHAPVVGQVVFAGVKDEQRGNAVEVRARDGQRVTFAHLGAISVKVGDAVAVGQVVGTVGSSGLSTGPHVHVEVLANGEAKDPQKVQGLVLIADQG